MKYFFSLLAFFCLFYGANKAQTLVPNSSDSGLYYYQQFQFQKVVQLLESDSGRSPSNSYLLAKSYQKLGQNQEAKKEYLLALQADSTNINYLNSFAEFCRKVEDHNSAIVTYQKLIELNPTNAYYYKKIGNSYLKTPYSFLAVTAFENAVQLNPKDIESRLLLVERYLELGLIDKAETLIHDNILKYPTNQKCIKQAIKLAYKLRDYEDLASKCEQYYTTGDSGLLVQKLHGIANYHLKNYSESIELMEEVVKVEVKSEVLHYYLGLSYQDSNQPEKAAKYIEKAIDLGISNNIENYYTRLGTVYEELGEYEKSIQAYKVAYSKSKNKILLYHLARNYDIYYKDKTTALKYYHLYLEENDTSNEAYFDYTKSRIQELKTAKHFSLDTL